MCVCVLVGICAVSVGALRGLKVFSPPELELHTGNCELPMRVLGPEFSPLQNPSFPPMFFFPRPPPQTKSRHKAVRKGKRICYCC